MIDMVTDTRNEVRHAVLNVLQYYAIFHYPLMLDEIYRNCSEACPVSAVAHALTRLEEEGLIHQYRNYYSIEEKMEPLVKRREVGNRLAGMRMPKAMQAGRIIYKFPFVKYVGISGSLSKGYAEAKSDFDFFIITSADRLWICRTMLHLFKKLTFLFGHQHRYCMNYFLDESRLEIEERNRFTAIELSTLIPVKGFAMHYKLLGSNRWMYDFLPNDYRAYEYGDKSARGGIVKSIAETFINTFSAARLNVRLMNVTDRRWRKKWAGKNYPAEDYELAFKTRVYVSKNHPANNQKKILHYLSKLKD